MEWDEVPGATGYETDGITYDSPADSSGNGSLFIYTQKYEGNTYTFRVRAHNDNSVSTWSNLVEVTCPPLDLQTYDIWESPNAVPPILPPPRPEPGVSSRGNPPLFRYLPDSRGLQLDGLTPAETENKIKEHLESGEKNCTPTVHNADGTGWTRTCDIYWTEDLVVKIQENDFKEYFTHDGDFPHHEMSHLHMTDSGLASWDPHHHCLEDDETCAHTPGTPGLDGHPDLPDPGDDWWEDALEEGVVSFTVGTGIGYFAGMVKGASTGARFGSRFHLAAAVVGGLVGAGAGMLVAFINHNNNAVSLRISGFLNCLQAPQSNNPLKEWERVEETIDEIYEEGAYTTVLKHHISACDVKKDD